MINQNKCRAIFAFLMVVNLSFSESFASEPEVKRITVDELSKKIEQKAIFDFNTNKVRNQYGVIPSATLVNSFEENELKQKLPVDKSKSMVFYCFSAMCSASTAAANVATKMGYTDVSVLTGGIIKWKEANQKTVSFPY